MLDLTCIYYTSNKEIPRLEGNIRKTILENIGDAQLISVSQKPIDFGINICVGEKVPSSHNAFRQLQIGAMKATTKYVCTAEADTLYPKEYFGFLPDNDRMIYKADNIYVIYALRGRKKICGMKREDEGAIIAGREYIIEVIDKQLEGNGLWSCKGDYDGSIIPYLFSVGKSVFFHNTVPIVKFKTDQNLHRKCPTLNRTNEIAVYGNPIELMRQYL